MGLVKPSLFLIDSFSLGVLFPSSLLRAIPIKIRVTFCGRGFPLFQRKKILFWNRENCQLRTSNMRSIMVLHHMAPEGRNAMTDKQALTQQILSMTPDELYLFICLAKTALGPQWPGVLAPARPTSD